MHRNRNDRKHFCRRRTAELQACKGGCPKRRVRGAESGASGTTALFRLRPTESACRAPATPGLSPPP